MKEVWRVTQNIPYGTLKTYGWIAKRLGRPNFSRAVGRALAQNPFPIIIPCHRVIKGNGELGGYSAPGGVSFKAELLKLEGIQIDAQGRVPLKYFS